MDWGWSFYKTMTAIVWVLCMSSYLTLLVTGGACHVTRFKSKYIEDEEGTFTYDRNYFLLVLLTFVSHFTGLLLLPKWILPPIDIFFLSASFIRLMSEWHEFKNPPVRIEKKDKYRMGLVYIDIALILFTIFYVHLVIQFTFTRVYGLIH